jgi:hypothetical protein
VEGSHPLGQCEPTSLAWVQDAPDPIAVRDLPTQAPPTTARGGHKEEAEVRGQEEQELVQKNQPLLEVRNRLGCVTAW